jgi:hypothetical protein
MSQQSSIRLVWDYLKVRKKWWLTPIIIFILLISLLMAVTAGTAYAPFIYTLF